MLLTLSCIEKTEPAVSA